MRNRNIIFWEEVESIYWRKFMDKYGRLCIIFNTIAYVLTLILCVSLILIFVNSILIRIVLIVISVVLCAYIEEKLISIFINSIIERILNLKK